MSVFILLTLRERKTTRGREGTTVYSYYDTRDDKN